MLHGYENETDRAGRPSKKMDAQSCSWAELDVKININMVRKAVERY